MIYVRSYARRRGMLRTTSLIAVAIMSAACGTRVSHREVLGASAESGVADAAGSEDTRDLPAAVVDGSQSNPSMVPTRGVSDSKPANTPGVGDSRTVATSGVGDPNTANTPGVGDSRVPSRGTTLAASARDTTGGGATGGPAPAIGSPGRRSPVLVAAVSTLSGPVGDSIAPITDAARVWVKHINARGGVNGHQVQLIVYDDGSDPARNRAQVQDAIERRHVVAFLAQGAPLSGQASVSYITSKRVPVVGGGEAASAWLYESPMYFPEAPAVRYALVPLIYAAAQLYLPQGKKKLGMVTCVEADQCRRARQAWRDEAPGSGFEIVYDGTVSLGQPDFTAECLAARGAGAEIVLLGFDGSSVRRMAASCARQGYRPTFGAPIAVIQASFENDPNLDGMLGISNVFPWFQANTPGTQEYQTVMSTLGQNVRAGVGSAAGWTQAKLFEKAAANLGEPPTSDAILRGLWSLKDETLDGLTPVPINFVPDTISTGRACWFNLVIKNGKWTTPDNYQAHCH